jgi:transcriptional regulator with XRE-family HTH domain
MPKMPTPRMLARMLYTLRATRADLALERLGEKIGVSDSHLERLEKRKSSVHYEHLERFQLFFGVPNGVVLAISHVAAMSRDIAVARAARDKKRIALETAKLDLMARYLRNLADRIAPEPTLKAGTVSETPLTRYQGLCEVPESWDNLLLDLVVATQKGLDPNKPTVFEDHVRLAEIVALTRRH